MSHKNKVPLVDQVKQALDVKLAIGRGYERKRRTLACSNRLKRKILRDLDFSRFLRIFIKRETGFEP